MSEALPPIMNSIQGLHNTDETFHQPCENKTKRFYLVPATMFKSEVIFR